MESQSHSETLAFAATYALLGRLWLTEVDVELLRQLTDPAIRDLFEATGGQLPAAVDATEVEALAIDYCQLFVGPRGHLPPIQSVWETGQFESQASSSMREFVEITRYRISATEQAAVDHLGCQLRLMGYLLQQSVSATLTEEREAAAQLSVAFFDRHLRWPTRLLHFAFERAETDFYRGMLQMTQAFLRLQSAG